MLNLIEPTLDFYNEHEKHYSKRLKSKASDNELWELSSQEQSELKNAYDEYAKHFKQNTLGTLTKYSFFSTDKKNKYLFLYKYSLAYYQNFIESLRYEGNVKIGDCPFCEHGKPTTLDHIIPKAEFPEFCDNLLNLVPMCPTCNTNKGTTFTDDKNQIVFINLYRDKIPDVQFLFLSITLPTNELKDNYEVDFVFDNKNLNNLDVERKLRCTYEKLHLLDFYKELSYKRIDAFREQLKKIKELGSFTKEGIKEILLSENYQKNFWEHVLIRGIIENETFFDFLYN